MIKEKGENWNQLRVSIEILSGGMEEIKCDRQAESDPFDVILVTTCNTN